MKAQITPEQLHKWYLEAITHLDSEDFNINADTPYEDLTAGQKSINIYIAKKINESRIAELPTVEEINKVLTSTIIATYELIGIKNKPKPPLRTLRLKEYQVKEKEVKILAQAIYDRITRTK